MSSVPCLCGAAHWSVLMHAQELGQCFQDRAAERDRPSVPPGGRGCLFGQ